MFVMDIPDVSPQAAAIVVAQAPQQDIDRTIGVCQPIENRPESKLSAVNGIDPLLSAYKYLLNKEGKKIDWGTAENAKVTILQPPAHGVLSSDFMYFSSNYHYEGQDKAAVLVEMGNYRIKIIYHFNLMQNVPGSTDEGDAIGDKRICPNGYVWRISLS